MWFCGEERFEKMPLNILCQPKPIVTHRNLDLLAANDGADDDARVSGRRRRIECVQNQIQHDLL
jgi:hypothetical protein